jgi:tRNA modification GTPase
MGEAAIHLVRLSGAQAQAIMGQCFCPQNAKRWQEAKNYTLYLGTFHERGQKIDQVLVARMAAPSSFTGEDVYEIHCHGGPLLAKKVLEVCLRAGARLAERGEFTKRAFLNGKLDLIQAEAIIDLISARTDSALKLAFSQMQGGLSKKIHELRDGILDIYSFIEAGIDFPEDGVEDLDRGELRQRLRRGISQTEELLAGGKTGKVLRDGLKTVIVGRPNVGKSSLLNAMLQEERAIVTDIPGTTRDEIHEWLNVDGILLQLIDTAGIRESTELIEQLGIERTRKLLPDADLILLMVEANVPLNAEERSLMEQYHPKVIVLANKCDLLQGKELKAYAPESVWLPFSVLEKKGFAELEREIKRRVYQGTLVQQEDLLSNVRQIQAVEKAKQALRQAEQALTERFPWDIISIDVRQAMRAVAEITGEDAQEALLENIFSRFCIGK